jgi:hypothetical protein
MLYARVKVEFRFGIVAAQIPSSSPVSGFRCASFFLRNTAMFLLLPLGLDDTVFSFLWNNYEAHSEIDT